MAGAPGAPATPLRSWACLIEQADVAEPWKAVTDAGATAELIAPKAGHAQAFHHLDPADKFPVDVVTAETDATSYDALMLPGGVANADQIRTDGPAVDFVTSFVERGAPIGVIWVDEEVHVDANLSSAVASPTISPPSVPR